MSTSRTPASMACLLLSASAGLFSIGIARAQPVTNIKGTVDSFFLVADPNAQTGSGAQAQIQLGGATIQTVNNLPVVGAVTFSVFGVDRVPSTVRAISGPGVDSSCAGVFTPALCPRYISFSVESFGRIGFVTKTLFYSGLASSVKFELFDLIALVPLNALNTMIIQGMERMVAGPSAPVFDTIAFSMTLNAPAGVDLADIIVHGGSVQSNTLAGTFEQSFLPSILIGVGKSQGFQTRYSSNLKIGNSVINITNAGTQTSPAATLTNICANVYTFSPDEQLISCCSCTVTPNALVSLSTNTDLISNTLTPTVPDSIVVKLVASAGSTCNPASIGPTDVAPGMVAWGTTLHALPTNPVTYGVTETRFAEADLSAAELSRLTSFCGFIQANGSGFGICRSCRSGGQGANRQ